MSRWHEFLDRFQVSPADRPAVCPDRDRALEEAREAARDAGRLGVTGGGETAEQELGQLPPPAVPAAASGGGSEAARGRSPTPEVEPDRGP